MQRLALLAIALFLAPPVFADVSPIRLEVECRSKSQGNPQAAGQPPAERSQTQTLFIKLFNTSKDAVGDLTVKYWFFARGMNEQEATIFKQGESRTTLEKGERKTVESEPVTSKYAAAGSKMASPGPNRAPVATRVPATGQKLTGYAVHVLIGDKIVGEYYSESSYKKKISGTPEKK